MAPDWTGQVLVNYICLFAVSFLASPACASVDHVASDRASRRSPMIPLRFIPGGLGNHRTFWVVGIQPKTASKGTLAHEKWRHFWCSALSNADISNVLGATAAGQAGRKGGKGVHRSSDGCGQAYPRNWAGNVVHDQGALFLVLVSFGGPRV